MSIWPQSSDVGNVAASLPKPDNIDEAQRTLNGVVPMTNAPEGANKPYLSTMNGKLTLSDGNNLTAFIGLKNVVGVMSPVVRISKAGFDAETTTDDNLIFNSAQNVFKIISTGTVTVATSGTGSFSTSVPHSLGFTPAVIAFVTYPSDPPSSRISVPFSLIFSPSGADTAIKIAAHAYVYTTSTSIDFNVSQIGSVFSNGNWRFTYYLLQETAI